MNKGQNKQDTEGIKRKEKGKKEVMGRRMDGWMNEHPYPQP
jgi:hypothetical protein